MEPPVETAKNNEKTLTTEVRVTMLEHTYFDFHYILYCIEIDCQQNYIAFTSKSNMLKAGNSAPLCIMGS